MPVARHDVAVAGATMRVGGDSRHGERWCRGGAEWRPYRTAQKETAPRFPKGRLGGQV